MNEFIEKAMLFINENTMLLIGICIFLILVLIGYLIDNSIKTRKLEKEEAKKAAEEPVAPVVPEVSEAVIETTPVINDVVETEEKIIEKSPADLKAEVITEPVVEEPVVAPVEPTPAPVIETESMEELLNKDFSKNAEVVNNLTDTQIINPVEPAPAPVVEEVKPEPKSIYKSNSKLSDILGKKKTEEKPKLETTQDFSDELDRILNKLNEEEINNRF